MSAYISNTVADPQVISLLRGGEVGIIPTDTVYGLVCRADMPAAVDLLYRAKVRDRKPGTIIASSPEQIIALGVESRLVRAVEHLWPNPISVILPCSSDMEYIHQGVMSLPFRIPHLTDELSELLQAVGPLLTTSANWPDHPTANTLAEAQAYYGDKIALYVDGGDRSGSLPSTIVRIVDGSVEVLRQGAVRVDEKTGRLLDSAN